MQNRHQQSASWLADLGWCEFFEKAFLEYEEKGLKAGRVAIENRDCFSVLTEEGEVTAEVAGRLLFTRTSLAELPKVGDWVALQIFEGDERAIIHHVLPRKTRFSRKVAGKKTDEQVIATNIDVVFVVQGLDGNFSVRRLERTLVLVHESRARPVVVLNKTDLESDLDGRIAEVREVAPAVDVLAVSAEKRLGLDGLKQMIGHGQTFAFIGSSGVGKSTLINRLVGDEVLKTRAVRPGDSKGRHTTTRRELIVLEDGGCLIDTPGMRELQLWQADDGMSDAFADIDELASRCRFSNCTHTREIKCAILAAVAGGTLAQERYDNYMKLQDELAFLETKRSAQAQIAAKQKERGQSKMCRQVQQAQRKKKGG